MTTAQRHSTGTSTAGASVGPRLRQRLSSLLLKPPDPTSETGPAAPRTASGEAARVANDKERLVGLLGAPFAAGIALLVYGVLVANDPPASLKDGLANSKHVALSLYGDLLGVLLVVAVAMLAAAWFRKRLFLGCLMALYGLAVFNLHYWGFGIPYVLFGAWLIVRAYRVQRDLREVSGASSGAPRGNGSALVLTPAASKRYTPPGSPGSRRR